MSEPDRLPLDDLVPNETNAKGHAIEQIRASIRRFGFVTPMVIDARTGKLAEGHGRSEALQAERASGQPAPKGIEVDKDGRWLVPVHRGWASQNDQEATAFLVAANRLVELGGWDDQALLQALETARQTPTGLEGIGYLDADIAALLARVEGPRPLSTASQMGELRYSVLVSCKDEHEQAELLEKLEADGRSCKAVMM